MVEVKPRESVVIDRELTERERTLGEWMLRNGEPEGSHYLQQLEQARVGELCPCGCASVNFNIGGRGVVHGPLHILGDFLFGEGDQTSGVFIFAIEGRLAGVEVFSYGETVHTELPAPAELRSYDNAENLGLDQVIKEKHV